jgi:hypothetical protein
MDLAARVAMVAWVGVRRRVVQRNASLCFKRTCSFVLCELSRPARVQANLDVYVVILFSREEKKNM